MNATGNYVLRRAGFEPASGEEMVHSVEELALLVEDTEEAGILDPDAGRVRAERLPPVGQARRATAWCRARRWRRWS